MGAKKGTRLYTVPVASTKLQPSDDTAFLQERSKNVPIPLSMKLPSAYNEVFHETRDERETVEREKSRGLN